MSKELSEDGADPKNGGKMAANETGSKVGGPNQGTEWAAGRPAERPWQQSRLDHRACGW